MTASIPLRMKFSGRRDRGGLRKVEAPSRFELEQSGICSPLPYHLAMAPYGAGNEIRTRYLHLGKVALCQMSYARKMVPPVGIEPTTRGFSVPCSTN